MHDSFETVFAHVFGDGIPHEWPQFFNSRKEPTTPVTTASLAVLVEIIIEGEISLLCKEDFAGDFFAPAFADDVKMFEFRHCAPP